MTGIVTASMMPLIIFGIGHACDATVFADVGGDALKRHDRGRTGLFGNDCLLGVDDIHDDAAFEHLGQSDFGPPS